MQVEQEELQGSKDAKKVTQDGMDKIRINDLARELEVKSKAILDYLPTIGVDDKKSHSSSLETDQVERVRKHFQGEVEKAAAEKSRSKGGVADEIRTKIDLSKISKPGDVLKAISKKATTEISVPPPVAKPAPSVPSKPVVPVAAKPVTAVVPAPVEQPAPAPAPKLVAPVIERPSAERPPVPSAMPAPPPQAAAPVAPPVVANVPRPPVTSAPAAAAPPTAHKPAAAVPPPRRVITPQTGPRPVYFAPVQPRATVQPGQPIGQRSAPGRPVPGQPIFQQQRPSMPGAKPPLRPGERRLHPTRMSPTGGRPMGARPGPGAGSALPPPPEGTRRPAGGAAPPPGPPSVPLGLKDWPMKGFGPPPTMAAVSNQPVPIKRSITST